MENVGRKSCVESTGMCWREPANLLPESALDFCKETSLHGVKYICQPKRHLCERVFWLFTLMAGGIAAGLLIANLWREYSHQPIIAFSPYEITIDQIPFPAVTVCNSNLLRRSGLEKLINSTERFLTTNDENERHNLEYEVTDMFLAREICNNQSTFGQKVNFTYARNKRNIQDILDQLETLAEQLSLENTTEKVWSFFLDYIPHKCHNMVKKCQFNEEVVDCNDHFSYEYWTVSICCTFNLIPEQVFNHSRNKWVKDLEKLNQSTLDATYGKQELYWVNDLMNKDGLLLSNRSDGIHAVYPGNISERHNWYTPKRQRNGGKTEGLSILLDPELHEYTCGLTDCEGFLLHVHPLTNSPNAKDMGMLIRPNTEVFVEITPSVTVANENLRDIPVKYRNCYFQNEKYLMTSWFYTLDECIDECIYNLTKKECNCTLTRKTYSMSYICELEDLTCAQEHMKRRTRNEFAETCQCLPLCTTVDYTIRMSSSVIDSGSEIKGWNNAGDENGTVISKNQFSIVHIYFVDEFVYARERKKMYGWVDLVANAGGVLGLCLGFSVLSLLECVYFLTFRLWCQNRRKKTVLEIITTHIAKLSKRRRGTEEISENRRIALRKLVETAMLEMGTINDLAIEEASSV